MNLKRLLAKSRDLCDTNLTGPCQYNVTTPWSRDLLQKLRVTRSRNSPPACLHYRVQYWVTRVKLFRIGLWLAHTDSKFMQPGGIDISCLTKTIRQLCNCSVMRDREVSRNSPWMCAYDRDAKQCSIMNTRSLCTHSISGAKIDGWPVVPTVARITLSHVTKHLRLLRHSV
jgi:hypothetical protein